MKARFTIFLVLAIFMLSGCASIQKARRADELEAENASLKQKLTQLEQEKGKEVSEFEQAKRELEESLKKEIITAESGGSFKQRRT